MTTAMTDPRWKIVAFWACSIPCVVIYSVTCLLVRAASEIIDWANKALGKA